MEADYVLGPDGDAPEGAVSFVELEPEEQFRVLVGMPWDGFSKDQSLDVVDRVMDGYGPEQRMEGIVASDQQALSEEIRADEQAARVRDFGEADAAGYADRMADAYAVQAEALGRERPSPAFEMEDLAETESGWPTFEEQLAELSSRYHGRVEEEEWER